MTQWTCGANDILALYKGPGIGAQGFELAFSGSTVSVDLVHSASCRVMIAETATYPSNGMVTLDDGARTCSAGCTAQQCTPAPPPNPPVVATFSFSVSNGIVTATRTLTAADVSNSGGPEGTLGCNAGDVETEVFDPK